MSSFQGIIRRNIVNTCTQFDKLGYASSNFTNYNTNAYKNVRFEQMINEDGYLDGVVRQDHAMGAQRRTERELDILINGPGFIPVTSDEGDVTYTRDGSLKIGKDGWLLTNDGQLVGDGIQVPTNYEGIRIKQDGSVYAITDKENNWTKLGQIPLVRFANPEGLKQGEMNKFIATEESGEPVLVKDHDSIVQGYLEQSNGSIYTTTSEIMRTNASMIASLRLVKVVDDLYSKAINLRQ